MAVNLTICEIHSHTAAGNLLTSFVVVVNGLALSSCCSLEPILMFKPRGAVRIILSQYAHQRLSEVLAAPLKELCC